MFLNDLNAIAPEILGHDSWRDTLRATASEREFVALLQQAAQERGMTLLAEDIDLALNAARIAWLERSAGL